jgi:hypothetical protein
MYEKMVKDFAKRGLEGKALSRSKAVRMRCLDCCSFQPAEVTRCPAEDCPLWFFRSGKDRSGGGTPKSRSAASGGPSKHSKKIIIRKRYVGSSKKK